MTKRLIGTLLVFLPAFSPVPGQTSGPSGDRSRKIQQYGKEKSAGAGPVMPGAEHNNTKASDKNGTDVAHKNPEYDVKLTGAPVVTIEDKNKTLLDYVFDWGPWAFNFLLVLVGAAAVYVAHLTRVAIERQAGLMEMQAALMTRQADIMERQTKLQEAAMTQFIDVNNWRVEILERSGPISSIPKALQVSYDVLNGSNLPLKMRAEFNFSGGVSQYLPYLYLLPRKPYTIAFRLDLKEDSATQYSDGELRIAVHGKFFHVGVTSQPSPLMSFDGNLVCGRMVTTRLESEWLVAGKDGEEKQGPN